MHVRLRRGKGLQVRISRGTKRELRSNLLRCAEQSKNPLSLAGQYVGQSEAIQVRSSVPHLTRNILIFVILEFLKNGRSVYTVHLSLRNQVRVGLDLENILKRSTGAVDTRMRVTG